MTITPRAPSWSGKVIAVGEAGQIARGRAAEFRHRGISLSTYASAVRALMEVGREPASVVLVPTDLADIPLFDFVDLVRSLTRSPVLAGLVDGYDVGLLGPLVEHGIAATVTLPVTPLRLAQAASVAHPPPAPAPVVLSCGALELDEAQHRVRWCGSDVRLSPKEFDILRHLMAAHPALVTVQQLVGHFEHGEDDRATRVRVAVRRLRLKLHAAAPRHAPPVVTVHGLGYRLQP